MGYIKPEDIVGYEVDMGDGNTQVVCADCISPEELKDIKKDNIIEDPKNAEKSCFCDRCGERIY